jgi:hypothetical protein
MPHIIYKGEADLKSLHEAFEAVGDTQDGWILKLLKAYLANDRRSILFEATAVRSGFSVNFYVLTEQKREGVTVRVDPRTNVEKNDGVKRCIALVASRLKAANHSLVFDKTNLPPHIFTPPPAAA